MRTQHGLSRLVNFSDAVVAIAITLLILPLVTSADEISTDVPGFLAENTFQLLVFVISFAVIGRFWMAHHQMYERAIGYSIPLMWANLLWLLSIVFLPFPTELLASGDRADAATYALYIGTMVVTTLASTLQQWILIRSPQLQAESVRGTLTLLPLVVTVAIMLAALAIAIIAPAIGLWSLLLFLVSVPVERLIRSLRRRRDGSAP